MNVVYKIIKIRKNNDPDYSKEDILTIFRTFQKVFFQYINFRNMVNKFKKYDILALHVDKNSRPAKLRGNFSYNLSYLLKNSDIVASIADRKYSSNFPEQYKYPVVENIFKNIERICKIYDIVDNTVYEILYDIFENTEKLNHEHIKASILDHDDTPSYEIIDNFGI